MDRTYCVYILASRSRRLYVGVTNNLERRMIEHRKGRIAWFTARYRIFRLVHYEVFGDIRLAIACEKEIKGWRREKKLWLINRQNSQWEDLAQRLDEERSAEKARIHAVVQERQNHKSETAKADPSSAGQRPRAG